MVIHQNQTSIKVRNEENVKQMIIAHISKMRQDIKILSTYLESAANFTSDRCGFVILLKKFGKLQIIDLDDSGFFQNCLFTA